MTLRVGLMNLNFPSYRYSVYFTVTDFNSTNICFQTYLFLSSLSRQISFTRLSSLNVNLQYLQLQLDIIIDFFGATKLVINRFQLFYLIYLFVLDIIPILLFVIQLSSHF